MRQMNGNIFDLGQFVILCFLCVNIRNLVLPLHLLSVTYLYKSYRLPVSMLLIPSTIIVFLLQQGQYDNVMGV